MNSKDLEKLVEFKKQEEMLVGMIQRFEKGETSEIIKSFWLVLEQFMDDKITKAIKDSINYIENTKKDEKIAKGE